jgi:hypothetical protein
MQWCKKTKERYAKRYDRIRKLRDDGYSLRDISAIEKITYQRVHAILKKRETACDN